MWRWRRRAAPGLRVPACPYGYAHMRLCPVRGGVRAGALLARHHGTHCGAARAHRALAAPAAAAAGAAGSGSGSAARVGGAWRGACHIRSAAPAPKLGWDRIGCGAGRACVAGAVERGPRAGKGEGVGRGGTGHWRVRALFALCSLRRSVGHFYILT